jgi:aspartate/glutamate racemase
MKKLGPVGGTGPESTVMYYRNVTHGVSEIFGSERPPKIAIGSLSAFEVFSFCTTIDSTSWLISCSVHSATACQEQGRRTSEWRECHQPLWT